MQEEVFLQKLELLRDAKNVSPRKEISHFGHLIPLSVFKTTLKQVFASNIFFSIVVIYESIAF